ncbi:MAG: hypothetical protein PHC75_05180 [Burkholderiales bacterium]|nr:hypothetical protein [Burkholderiales bacterium]
MVDLSATQISNLSGISRNSINKYLMGIRQRIYDYFLIDSSFSMFGDVELDESYFGARITWSWLLRIRGKVSAESIVHTDGWRGYGGLVDIGYDKHFCVNHSNSEFAY